MGKDSGKDHGQKAAAATPASSRSIRVRATMLGFYGNQRKRVGDIFTVPEHMFSKRWMVRVAPGTPETTTASQEALRRQHEDIVKGLTPPKDPVPGQEGATGDQAPLGE